MLALTRVFQLTAPLFNPPGVSSSHTVRVVAQTPGFVAAVFRKRP
jgi:hypothetical protein